MQNTNNNLVYAGFWVRFGAFIIDTLLILIATLPIISAIYDVEHYFNQYHFELSVHHIVDSPLGFFIRYVLPSIIVILFWKYHQATPGKMALGTTILDAQTGEKPSTAQCIGRYFAYIPSFFFLCFGFLWIIFDKRKQSWHDKLAGTVVVRKVNTEHKLVEFNTPNHS